MHWLYMNRCLIWDPWVQLDLRSSRASPPKCSVRCNSESHSVMSNSLQPRELYRPWNSPGQNTGFCSLSLLQRIFPTQESNWDFLHCRWIFLPIELSGKPQMRYACSLYYNIFWIITILWKSLSHIQLFATPWSIQSMGFCRPEYWSG